MHKLIGGTRAQFRTCKAHYLARSVGRPKRRYTGCNDSFTAKGPLNKQTKNCMFYVQINSNALMRIITIKIERMRFFYNQQVYFCYFLKAIVNYATEPLTAGNSVVRWIRFRFSSCPMAQQDHCGHRTEQRALLKQSRTTASLTSAKPRH